MVQIICRLPAKPGLNTEMLTAQPTGKSWRWLPGQHWWRFVTINEGLAAALASVKPRSGFK
jgi:hypothetical protein